MKTTALIIATAALLSGCKSEPMTLRDEAERAQENLAEAREQAAEIVAESEEEAVDIIADARQQAKQEVRAATEEADVLVQDAKQDLDAVLNELSNAPQSIKTSPPAKADAGQRQRTAVDQGQAP